MYFIKIKYTEGTSKAMKIITNANSTENVIKVHRQIWLNTVLKINIKIYQGYILNVFLPTECVHVYSIIK